MRHTQSYIELDWRNSGIMNVKEYAKLEEMRHNEFDRQQARL
jgi:hypothetical protein